MSMGQVCLIVLAVVVGLAMILYLSCLLLFRTGTETAFRPWRRNPSGPGRRWPRKC